MMWRNLFLSIAGFGVVLSGVQSQPELRVPGANNIEVFRSLWWGTLTSKRSRPIYRVASIDNRKMEVRHAILPGRELGDYTMPCWPIRSFVSIVNRPAEIAHCSSAEFSLAGESKTIPFVVRTGFELATFGETDVLRVTNKSSDASGQTINGEFSDLQRREPLLMEHSFAITAHNPSVQILARCTNTSSETLTDVVMNVSYRQSFNWSNFGVGEGMSYRTIQAPASGTATALFAYSEGMQRGYEIVAGEGTDLSFQLSEDLNAWVVRVSGRSTTMAPGESISFRYVVRTLDGIPKRLGEATLFESQALLESPFHQVEAAVYNPAPIKSEGRVTLPQVIADLERPKTRGITLDAGVPQVYDDLQVLKDWGCNLGITGIRKGTETADVIARGHGFGMEIFVAGRGGFMEGAPRFDALYDRSLPLSHQADSHGQDEDHYYWEEIPPTLDFEAGFGKPMALANQEERVRYWGRCFREKWRGVLDEVRKHSPNGGVWFYQPTPSVAGIEPLDYYDIFLAEIAKLGDALTVFPFYYGVDYNQPEYMMRRWKDAGASRAVFLPMIDFVTKPSHFLRAITAARRGQADGACGFHFQVGGAKPEEVWQWQSVMLGAWANFPTPDLDCYCFIEEPAELVEKLAFKDVDVVGGNAEIGDYSDHLESLLPGWVRRVTSTPEAPASGRLRVVVGGPDSLACESDWPYDLREQSPGLGKGVIQMQGDTVSLCGTDRQGIENAKKWFLRWAGLAKSERGG